MILIVYTDRKQIQPLYLTNQLIPSAGHSDLPSFRVTQNTDRELVANVTKVTCPNPERGKSKADPIFLPNPYSSFSFLEELNNEAGNFEQPICYMFVYLIWWEQEQGRTFERCVFVTLSPSCVYNRKLGVALTRAS